MVVRRSQKPLNVNQLLKRGLCNVKQHWYKTWKCPYVKIVFPCVRVITGSILMLQLLMKNPEKRLTDLLALQNTSFYSNFNFTAVLEKKVGPYGLVIVQLNLYPILMYQYVWMNVTLKWKGSVCIKFSTVFIRLYQRTSSRRTSSRWRGWAIATPLNHPPAKMNLLRWVDQKNSRNAVCHSDIYSFSGCTAHCMANCLW